MAAPTFIGVGTTAENTGNISLGLHASTIEGDFLIMIVEHANQPPATRTGWEEVEGSPQGFGTPGAAGAVGLSVWYKFAGASEPAFTWLDVGDHQVGGILTWRGVDPTTPINASVGDADASLQNLMVFPDIPTTEDECGIVLAMAIDRDINSTNTQFRDTFTLNGAAMTKVLDEGTSANQGGVVGAAVGEAPTAGTYGADGQLGGSNTYGQCRIVVALNPILGAGAAEAEPDDTTHNHTAGQPTVVAKVSVSPNGSAHGHTGGSPTITAHAVVTPNSAQHGHSASSPTVAFVPLSVPDDASHGHTAGSPAIVAKAVATPASARHAHTAGSPSILSRAQVDPASVAQGHSAGSPSATARTAVAPDSAQHGHAAGSPTVAARSTVPPNSARHPHTASSPFVRVTTFTSERRTAGSPRLPRSASSAQATRIATSVRASRSA